MRSAREAAARALWQQGDRPTRAAIEAALDGENAADYLQAWANFARVAETYRFAA